MPNKLIEKEGNWAEFWRIFQFSTELRQIRHVIQNSCQEYQRLFIFKQFLSSLSIILTRPRPAWRLFSPGVFGNLLLHRVVVGGVGRVVVVHQGRGVVAVVGNHRGVNLFKLTIVVYNSLLINLDCIVSPSSVRLLDYLVSPVLMMMMMMLLHDSTDPIWCWAAAPPATRQLSLLSSQHTCAGPGRGALIGANLRPAANQRRPKRPIGESRQETLLGRRGAYLFMKKLQWCIIIVIDLLFGRYWQRKITSSAENCFTINFLSLRIVFSIADWNKKDLDFSLQLFILVISWHKFHIE